MSCEAGVLREEREWSGSVSEERRCSHISRPVVQGEETSTPGELAGEAVFAEEGWKTEVDDCVRAGGFQSGSGLGGDWGPRPARGGKIKRVPVTY